MLEQTSGYYGQGPYRIVIHRSFLRRIQGTPVCVYMYSDIYVCVCVCLGDIISWLCLKYD